MHRAAQVDTGSTVIGVPAKECTACEDFVFYDLEESHMVRYPSEVCCSETRCESDTRPGGCAFHLSYGDKSGAHGVLAHDTVRLANLSTQIYFGAIFSEFGPFESSKYIDGILGMAFPRLGCTPSCVDSFIGQLSASTGIADSFAMCLGPSGGAMVLGGNDEQLYVPPIHYRPLRSDSYFAVRASAVMMDTASVASFVDVVLDSGTTLCLLPEPIWHAFWDHNISPSDH